MSTPRRRAQLELDLRLRRLAQGARRLPALLARGGLENRQAVAHALSAGQTLKPQWQESSEKVPGALWKTLSEAQKLASQVPGPQLHNARLEELELELMLIEAMGQAKQARPLAKRLYGDTEVQHQGRPLRLIAATLLASLPATSEEKAVRADGKHGLAAMMRYAAQNAGLNIEVEIERRLVANAAAGDRTVYIADRNFGAREARRLAIHEVLAHLVAAANGRSQRLALLEVGTAKSLGDQEGLAIAFEEDSGFLDDARVRTLAARVWVADRVHHGAAFEDTIRHLHKDFAFSATEAVALGERAYRGGGITKDVVYLESWLRLRQAFNDGEATREEMLMGKVSLGALPGLRKLMKEGEVRGAARIPPVLAIAEGLAGPAHEPQWRELV